MLTRNKGKDSITVLVSSRLLRAFFIRILVLLFVISLGSSFTLPAWGGVQDHANDTDKEQKVRETVKQEFLRKHQDPSGRIRPDLWSKGMEHASRMHISPNIGARTAPPPTTK